MSAWTEAVRKHQTCRLVFPPWQRWKTPGGTLLMRWLRGFCCYSLQSLLPCCLHINTWINCDKSEFSISHDSFNRSPQNRNGHEWPRSKWFPPLLQDILTASAPIASCLLNAFKACAYQALSVHVCRRVCESLSACVSVSLWSQCVASAVVLVGD